MHEAEASTLSLERLRQDWLDTLRQLEESHEFVVAAYLTAAIDALDDSLARAGIERAPLVSHSPLDVVVLGMIQRFGDRATSVARQQLAEASGEALRSWAAICHRLSLREANTD